MTPSRNLSISWFLVIVKSLLNRKVAVVLTVLSMTLSLLLLMTVERIQRAAQDGFTQTISGVDLIVGARSGPLQLLLYSVFNMGQATQNISYDIYQKWAQNELIEYSIPYSLGDGHRGFRVVATNNDFFKYYKFRSTESVQFQDGGGFKGYFDVVLGAEVAKSLNYKNGDKVVVNHGSTKGDSMQAHDDKPFKVVGVLKPTGTPLDRSLYISLEGMEAIHLDWKTGAAPQIGQEIKADQITTEMVRPQSITSFFVRAKSRIDVLKLQREVNESIEEPLLAIIPGIVLSELWSTLSTVEWALKTISFLVMIVGLFSMLIALITSLNERRREMAILRALGAGLKNIAFLIVFETVMMISSAVVLACVMKVILEWILSPWLKTEYGLFLQAPSFGFSEIMYMLILFFSGLILSLIPAYQATRSALKDGLTVR